MIGDPLLASQTQIHPSEKYIQVPSNGWVLDVASSTGFYSEGDWDANIILAAHN